MNIRKFFEDENVVKYMEPDFEGLTDNLFILWMTYDPRRLRFIWSDVKEAFDTIREEVLLRSLLRERAQTRKKSSSEHRSDYGESCNGAT